MALLKPKARTSEMIQTEIAEAQKKRSVVERGCDRLMANRPAILLHGTDDELNDHDAEQRRLSVAIERIDARLGALRQELVVAEAAEDQVRREATAASLEAAAARADDAIATILKAVAEIDRARTALATAISPEAIGLYAPPSNAVEYGPSYLTTALFYDYEGNAVVGALTAEQVAARVVGHLLAPTLPSLGIAKLEDTYVRKASGQQTGILAPIEHAPAAKALLTDNMRARAVEIRRPAPQAA